MSDGVDIEELARRYLDLWQDQVTAMANDPELAEAVERILAVSGIAEMPGAGQTGAAGAGGMLGVGAWPAVMMAALATGLGGMPPAVRTATPGLDGREAARGEHAKTAGSQAAAGAPERGDLDVDELLRRLAVLEERVAFLESEPGGERRAASKRSRERQS